MFTPYADPAELSAFAVDSVFLTCFEYDFEVYAGLLATIGVRVRRAATLDDADFLLAVTDASILLCDAAFPGGTWDLAAGMLAAVHPGVRLIVVANEMDRRFWATELERVRPPVISRPLRWHELRGAMQAYRGVRVRP